MSGTIVQCYDFETEIPAAYKRLFESEDYQNVYTAADGLEQNRERPRIELFFTPNGEAGHQAIVGDYIRADSFNGALAVTVVSNTKPEDVTTAQHAELVASVRDVIARSKVDLRVDREGDDTLMPYHSVHDVTFAGSSPKYEGSDGYYETQLNFEIGFGIRPDAWPTE